MLQKNSIKNSNEKIKMFKKGPLAIESFVTISLFDCDHTPSTSTINPCLTCRFATKIHYIQKSSRMIHNTTECLTTSKSCSYSLNLMNC
jgi:hypothetical protein